MNAANRLKNVFMWLLILSMSVTTNLTYLGQAHANQTSSLIFYGQDGARGFWIELEQITDNNMPVTLTSNDIISNKLEELRFALYYGDTSLDRDDISITTQDATLDEDSFSIVNYTVNKLNGSNAIKFEIEGLGDPSTYEWGGVKDTVSVILNHHDKPIAGAKYYTDFVGGKKITTFDSTLTLEFPKSSYITSNTLSGTIAPQQSLLFEIKTNHTKPLLNNQNIGNGITFLSEGITITHGGGDNLTKPDKPGSITLSYKDSDPLVKDGRISRETAMQQITIAKYENGRWNYMGGIVDTKKKTVKAPFSDFGTYAVIMNNSVYKDLTGWSKPAVMALSWKGIIESNRTDGVLREDLKKNINRFDFTALLAKGLLLAPTPYNDYFSDLNSNTTTIDKPVITLPVEMKYSKVPYRDTLRLTLISNPAAEAQATLTVNSTNNVTGGVAEEASITVNNPIINHYVDLQVTNAAQTPGNVSVVVDGTPVAVAVTAGSITTAATSIQNAINSTLAGTYTASIIGSSNDTVRILKSGTTNPFNVTLTDTDGTGLVTTSQPGVPREVIIMVVTSVGSRTIPVPVAFGDSSVNVAAKISAAINNHFDASRDFIANNNNTATITLRRKIDGDRNIAVNEGSHTALFTSQTNNMTINPSSVNGAMGDRLLVNNQEFIFVPIGSPLIVPNVVTIQRGVDATATSTNIRNAINNLSLGVTASSSGNVVTLRAVNSGLSGNNIPLSVSTQNASALVLSNTNLAGGRDYLSQFVDVPLEKNDTTTDVALKIKNALDKNTGTASVSGIADLYDITTSGSNVLLIPVNKGFISTVPNISIINSSNNLNLTVNGPFLSIPSIITQYDKTMTLALNDGAISTSASIPISKGDTESVIAQKIKTELEKVTRIADKYTITRTGVNTIQLQAKTGSTPSMTLMLTEENMNLSSNDITIYPILSQTGGVSTSISPRFSTRDMNYIMAAINNGLVLGKVGSDGKVKMSPEDSLTREEAAVFVSRALKLKVSSYSTKDLINTNKQLQKYYTDSDQIADWAKPYVFAVTKAGIMEGYNSQFSSKGTLTFEEAAALTYKIMIQLKMFGN